MTEILKQDPVLEMDEAVLILLRSMSSRDWVDLEMDRRTLALNDDSQGYEEATENMQNTLPPSDIF